MLARAICTGVLLFTISIPSSAFGGLVLNGGFETGDFSGWALSGDSSLNFVQSGFAHSGGYAAWFGETGDLGSLSQTLNTNAGSSYTLSFWFAGYGDDPSEFTASIGGHLLLDLINPPFDSDYKPYNFIFTATSSSTLLNFGFRDDANFINLDDVSVTAATVPEPMSMISLGLGMITIAGYSVYRSKRSQ